MDKLVKLRALGQHRRHRIYAGYHNIAEFHQGRYETDFVSPYTKSAGNVDAALAQVLQDWASSESLSAPFAPARATLGHSPERITNIWLKDLLRRTLGLELADVFATNLFPFIKHGGMSKPIPQTDLDRAFKELCWPQIKVVQPKAVVCLGDAVYKTLVRNLGFPPSRGVGDSVLMDGCLIWHQYHPAARVSTYEMEQAWRAMKVKLQPLLTRDDGLPGHQTRVKGMPSAATGYRRPVA